MPSLIDAALGIFLVLHGAVHLWYVVLSQGWVEAEGAMGWNGESWLLSERLSDRRLLDIASGLYTLVAVGFAAGGLGLVLTQPWWEPVTLFAATVSTTVIVTLWDGRRDQVVEKGAVGVVINFAVLGWLLVG